jgi:hypothetical protein
MKSNEKEKFFAFHHLVVTRTGATAPGSSQLGFSWPKDWPVKRDVEVKIKPLGDAPPSGPRSGC